MLFCRLEDRELHSGVFSEGAISVDLLELKDRPSYNTFQHDENKMHYPRGTTIPYPQGKKLSVQRQVERQEEDNKDVWGGIFQSGHTAEDGGKATQKCDTNERLFAHRNSISANLKTLPEEDIAEKYNVGRRNIV